MKHSYFISDLHLSENRPELTALFVDFMQNLAPQAERLYILGDLFDFWIGDDEQSALIQQVKDLIKSVSERGVQCYFQHGNRDFLIGERFSKETGAQLLPDYQLIPLYDKKILLCHGDTLCIDDEDYQQFRRRVHQKWLQRLFLCLPLKVRVKIAEKIRAKSNQDKQAKSQEIMDVKAATEKGYRHKGLASASGASLLLRFRDKTRIPDWDADSLFSASLGERLGYHTEREYKVYQIAVE